MAYVVTGATGHIGNNLVKRLIGLNQKVRILTRRVDESIDNLQAEYKIGDVFNREFLLENINSEDVVIHLAGVIDVKNNKKEQTMKINYEGTKLITDICIEKKVKVTFILVVLIVSIKKMMKKYLNQQKYIPISLLITIAIVKPLLLNMLWRPVQIPMYRLILFILLL